MPRASGRPADDSSNNTFTVRCPLTSSMANDCPMFDNLVNLLLAEDFAPSFFGRSLRVLAPGGVLYTKQDGQWRKIIKPRPAGIDEWTHFLHDASGNAVGHDQVVGPPGRLQWMPAPTFTRSHEHTPSLEALVSSGGRIFYIVDECPSPRSASDPQWQLVARDAFNGIAAVEEDGQPVVSAHNPLGQFSPPARAQTGGRRRSRLRVAGRAGAGERARCGDGPGIGGAGTHSRDRGDRPSPRDFAAELCGVTNDRVAELARWKQLVAQEKSPLPIARRGRATGS